MLFELVHGDLPRQHPVGNTLRFTGGPVPADSRQGNAIGTQLRGDPINTGTDLPSSRKSGGIPYNYSVSTRFSLSTEMSSKLTRDGTSEPVSKDQILRRERGQGNVHFLCSADHEQDWQPYPVDPTTGLIVYSSSSIITSLSMVVLIVCISEKK